MQKEREWKDTMMRGGGGSCKSTRAYTSISERRELLYMEETTTSVLHGVGADSLYMFTRLRTSERKKLMREKFGAALNYWR
jgi:predicted Zn-dependent peptidase